jgi:uncharacterized protein YegJ (DUF2314 family)
MSILNKIKSLFVRPAQPAEKDPISVVLLLSKPSALDEPLLRETAARAWGRELDPSRNEFAVISGPLAMLSFERRMFHIICLAKPYFDDPEAAARAANELRQQKAIREQVAWMSIDLLRPENPTPSEKDECYRRLCSFAAALLDESCLAVYLPEFGYFRVHDSTLREALVSNDPLNRLKDAEHVPVVPIESTDGELEEAVAEARRRWPEFVQAFRSRKKNEAFAVKASFTDGENTEWMWVIVSEIRGDTVAGELGNAPVNVGGLQEGAMVEVSAAEIGDWMYRDGKRDVGGFSVKVLTKSMRSRSGS